MVNADRFSKFFQLLIRKKILCVYTTKIYTSPAVLLSKITGHRQTLSLPENLISKQLKAYAAITWHNDPANPGLAENLWN